MRAELGKSYRDRVTGFEGVAAARAEYLTGCAVVTLKGESVDGKPAEVAHVDEPYLEAIEGGRSVPTFAELPEPESVADLVAKKPGGPRDVPAQRS